MAFQRRAFRLDLALLLLAGLAASFAAAARGLGSSPGVPRFPIRACPVESFGTSGAAISNWAELRDQRAHRFGAGIGLRRVDSPIENSVWAGRGPLSTCTIGVVAAAIIAAEQARRRSGLLRRTRESGRFPLHRFRELRAFQE